MVFRSRSMQAAAAFSLAAALTFAPASVLTAALPFAAPADVYAAVVEGSHAVDPAALSGRESYGPGTVGAFREQKTDDVSGSGTVGGSQAQSSYSSADLLTLPCPAGLEPDLWEAAKVSVRLYDEAVRTNLAEVNAVRKAAGVPEVVPDQELCMIAAYRAAQISKYRHLSHYGASGEFLANIVAAQATGNPDASVYENYYYELSDWARTYRAPADAQAGDAAAGGNTAGQAAGPGVVPKTAWDPSVEFRKDSMLLASEGQIWLTNSPNHYSNMTYVHHTRLGIGLFVSPEGQPVLDTMVQLFR